MIEASCGACGTITRVAIADVPFGAKFITCSGCKSRVPVPASALAAAAMPAMPAIPSRPRPPAPPVQVPVPPASGATGDVIDLADLPAPRRPGADSGPARQPSGPLEIDALLGPPGVAGDAPRRSRSGDIVARATAESDLPAPRRTTTNLGRTAASSAGPIDAGLDLTDLPVPRASMTKQGMSTARVPTFTDLPAPVSSSALADLPAPVRASPFADLPAPVGSSGFADLPAPVRSSALADLPAPVRSSALADLPAPVGAFADLPAPAGAFADLPAPAGAFADLPAPAGAFADLPAPAGAFADLPAPAGAFADLPAPASAFADLPAPAGASPARPPVPMVGFSMDEAPAVPGAGTISLDLDDDVPTRSLGGAASGGPGLFDDLPPPGAPLHLPPTGDAPFFDLPPPVAEGPSAAGERGRADGGSAAPGPSPGFFDAQTSIRVLSDRGAPAPSGTVDLGPVAGGAVSGPGPARAASADYGDLELPRPTAAASGSSLSVVVGPRTISSTAMAPKVKPGVPMQSVEATIELAEPDQDNRPRTQRPSEVATTAVAVPTKARRAPLFAGLALGVGLAGGAGVYLYQRHAAKVALAEEVNGHLKTSLAALVATDPGHWQRAAAAADRAVAAAEDSVDGYGLAAEARLAGALDEGTDAQARTGRAKSLIAKALERGLTGPALDRAQALQAIATRQADRAIAKLTGLTRGAPKDALLHLYLGWAQHQKGDEASAIKTLDEALAAAAPGLRPQVLYARGQAKLGNGDLAGARADFAAVLELAKEHVGAQVGVAAATPATEASQREADLVAVLQRKDLDKVDPRAVLLAWVLAGDEALRGGRLDTARDRYRQALKVAPNDVAATIGLAAAELRDDKIDAASELVASALKLSPDDVRGHLVAAEIEGKQKKYDAAEARLTALENHQPPLGPIDAARLKLIRGQLLETQGKLDDAVTAYAAGAQLAGEADLAPTMAAARLLGALASREAVAEKAAEYRDRADALLGKLSERAAADPTLARTLGIAYLQSDAAAKAEGWLRKAADARPDDVDALYQLAAAITRQGRDDEAILLLRRAVELAEGRLDLRVALARAYEGLGRDDDAAQVYAALLKQPDVDVQIRSRAGRFYARMGKLAEAGAQGEEILKADPRGNAVGFYLRAAGLMARGEHNEARKLLQAAIDLDPDPAFYEAQGQAAERLAVDGDTKMQDAALIAYKAAIDGLAEAKAPPAFGPLAGRGRIYLLRGEVEKAVADLLEANRIKADDPDVLAALGTSYHRLGQHKVAIEWLVRANRYRPSAEASWLLGTIYFDQNDAAGAAAALSIATRLGMELEHPTSGTKAGRPVPWLTDALYLLGRVENDRHNDAGARRAWELFLGRNPTKQAQVEEVKYQLRTGLRAN